MQIVVRGRHTDVSDQFRELAEEKLQRMERFGLDIARIDVEVSKENNPRLADRAIEVELTCHSRGPLLRAESHASSKGAALDEACDTLSERLRRAADKRRSKRRRKARVVPAGISFDALSLEEGTDEPDEAPELDAAGDVVYSEGPVIVRQKTHETEPMSVADAVDSLELVGHDFFFFFDVEAAQPSVVYRRRGYDYGLIRLQVAETEEA